MDLCFKLFLVGFLSLYSAFFLSFLFFFIYLIIIVWSLDIGEE